MTTLRWAAVLLIIAPLVGCVSTGPRFPADVQQSFADEEMRRMDTEHLRVYYPAQRRDEALQIATRLETCLVDLHDKTPRPTDWGPVPIFLPEVEFNNAYVAFGPGNDPHIVVPTFFTANLFGDLGYTPSVSAVGCHEMVHYVHLTQVHGLYQQVNNIFGPSINPQTGLDLWFFEGLATYYESQLVDGVGRYGSPIWENIFAAGLADTDLDGGRLSEWDRTIPHGAHYLVGSYFVAYLVETYGEARLWQLVDRQGASIVFPFAVSLRFRSVYGKSLSGLIEEFVQAMDERFPARQRQDDQQRKRWLGRTAMLETSPGGQTATFSADVDQVAALEVFDAEGQRRIRRRIPDVLPGRTLVGARQLEALRFSPDEQSLYFLVNHRGPQAPRTDLMHLDLNSGELRIVHSDTQAVGWDLVPEGDAAVIARADGHRIRFHQLSLEGDHSQDLFSLPPGAYVAWVRLSPDGTRLAATVMEDDAWSVVVFDRHDGTPLGQWSTGESHRPVFDPMWIDDERLLFVGADEARIEIFEGHLADGHTHRHSNVPYMAFNPRPGPEDTIEFLNRQDWGWSHDELRRGAKSPTEAVHFSREHDPAGLRGYESIERPAQVLDDTPYSTREGLFIPRLRVPEITIADGGDELFAGLGISGRDELGFHNWALYGRWDFAEEQLSGSLAYVNTQLAPWRWSLQIASQWLTQTILLDDDPMETTDRSQRDRFARLEISRAIYDIPLWFEFLAADFFRESTQESDEDRRRLLGPEVGSRYRASRTTPHGGTQWLVGISGLAGGYASALGSDFSMGHFRSQIEVQTPLPVARRHRLRLSGRTRILPGAPDDDALMRVGGFGSLSPIFVTGDAEEEPLDQQVLPRGILFSEPLRGYEDLGLVTNRVAIGDLNYRHPWIIDRGAASMFGLFPAAFVREFGLELFGSAATRFDGQMHGAVGASADLSTVIWRIPLQMRYQVAQRLFDDEKLVHTFVVGAGFGL